MTTPQLRPLHTRPRQREYIVSLVGTTIEASITKLDHRVVNYWSGRTPAELFRQTHTLRLEDDDIPDDSPVDCQIGEWSQIDGERITGVRLNECLICVTDDKGRDRYSESLRFEEGQQRHVRSKFHYNYYGLTKDVPGVYIGAVQYEGEVTYRLLTDKPFDPDELKVGWTYLLGESWVSSVTYKGEPLEYETGNACYDAQIAELAYRDSEPGVRRIHHREGSYPDSWAA